MLLINPREYQTAIFETAKKYNALVVLPTGLGKTLIALMLSIETLKKHPLSKILFLAPTKPLIEQHFNYFKKNLSELFADLQFFTGSVQAEKRKKIWQTAEIIFSTPQCIANDLENFLYDLKEVSLLIIDEAHRCLKNYDYTKVVEKYKHQAVNEKILGLTASPGSDPEIVKQICKNLNIQKIELRTRDSPDVKPYLQELEFQKIEIPFPQEFIELRVLFKRIFDNATNKLRERNYLQGPANKITLLNLQTRLAMQVSQRNFAAMYGMTLTAQAIKISHALELLETQTLSGLNEYLKSLQKQAIDKKSRAVQSLVKSPEFNAAMISIQHLLSKKFEHPKIEKLSILIENEFKENKDAKIIIFTQFRETASLIYHHLSQITGIKPSVFVGQAKKATKHGNTGLSQKEQKQIIEKFKEGEINILVCTSIGEEGLDIPEVSAVIFYEPVPSAIRKIQRTGRTARLSPGKLIILITKDTKDEIHHYASSARERKMHKTIHIIKEELKNKEKATSLDKF
ncbi:MAG: DEAD/DEAH box helicase [Nanoarchaeota archaeon]